MRSHVIIFGLLLCFLASFHDGSAHPSSAHSGPHIRMKRSFNFDDMMRGIARGLHKMMAMGGQMVHTVMKPFHQSFGPPPTGSYVAVEPSYPPPINHQPQPPTTYPAAQPPPPPVETGFSGPVAGEPYPPPPSSSGHSPFPPPTSTFPISAPAPPQNPSFFKPAPSGPISNHIPDRPFVQPKPVIDSSIPPAGALPPTKAVNEPPAHVKDEHFSDDPLHILRVMMRTLFYGDLKKFKHRPKKQDGRPAEHPVDQTKFYRLRRKWF